MLNKLSQIMIVHQKGHNKKASCCRIITIGGFGMSVGLAMQPVMAFLSQEINQSRIYVIEPIKWL